LYRQHQHHLLTIGLRFKWSREEVMDLINQLFLDLVEKKIAWNSISNPKAYILTAFKRKLVDHSRKHKQWNEIHDAMAVENAYEPSAEERITRDQVSDETIRKIRVAYQKLPARCRKAIFMKFYEGLSTEEMAEKSGLAVRTIYNNLFEGIKILRKEMAETAGQSPSLFLSSLFLAF
jgi:RNA polymerase sigma-70 factor (ECF subfamily)